MNIYIMQEEGNNEKREEAERYKYRMTFHDKEIFHVQILIHEVKRGESYGKASRECFHSTT